MTKVEQRDFIEDVAITLAGVGVGVVADKIVGDMLLAGNIPNPAVSTVQMHDVALVATELVGAYYAKKRGKVKAKKFLVGMASAVVATDVYEVVATSGRWFGTSSMSFSAPATYGGVGKYNNRAPVAGPVGAYLKPVMWTYAPR